MVNKQATGDYYRLIIDFLRENLLILEKERMRYSRFKRYVSAIDKNIQERRITLAYYEYLLDKYIKEGWAE